MEQNVRRMVIFGREFVCYGDTPEVSLVRLFGNIDFDGPNGCWLWRAYRNAGGYGQTTICGKSIMVHRFLWHVFKGEFLPTWIDLHHQVEAPVNCIGPQCCNPEHLEPVTAKQHLERTPQHIMYLREWRADSCPKGHPLTKENIYVFPGSSGKRRCRLCHNEWQNQKNRAKAAERPKEPELAAKYCPQGHEFTPENSYTYKGLRFCRTCHAELTARRYHEKRAARGIPSSRRILFADRTVCSKGHDLTLPGAIYKFKSRGYERSMCDQCFKINHRASYEKRKLAHANDSKPEPRKRGPKPRIQAAGI